MKVVRKSTNECLTNRKGALDNLLLIERSSDRIYETNMSTAYLTAEEKTTR